MNETDSRLQAFTDLILRTDPDRFKTRQEALDFFAEHGFTEEEVGRYLAVQVEIITRTWKDFTVQVRESLQTFTETLLTIFNNEE